VDRRALRFLGLQRTARRLLEAIRITRQTFLELDIVAISALPLQFPKYAR
jgi:hypothetical protein